MKIVLLEPLGISLELLMTYKQQLEELDHEFVYYTTLAANEQEQYDRAKDAEILIIANHSLRENVLSRLKHLKMIDVAFTGVDHIDLDFCKKQGIIVCNASGYSNTSVGELVIGHVLALYRHILEGDHRCRHQGTNIGLTGMEIKGKTVGIIGTGHIGIETTKLFHAFGANVLGWSRSISQDACDAGITYVDLDTLLQQSDIISLHLPMNASTKKFLDETKIAQMKSNAILVNCARGGIVDSQALAKALNEEKIAGAAIDVFDHEPPLLDEEPLHHAKNCVLSPHVAFLTEEAMIRRAKIVFDNILAYLSGKPTNII